MKEHIPPEPMTRETYQERENKIVDQMVALLIDGARKTAEEKFRWRERVDDLSRELENLHLIARAEGWWSGPDNREEMVSPEHDASCGIDCSIGRLAAA